MDCAGVRLVLCQASPMGEAQRGMRTQHADVTRSAGQHRRALRILRSRQPLQQKQHRLRDPRRRLMAVLNEF